jgi:hypothetical protein
MLVHDLSDFATAGRVSGAVLVGAHAFFCPTNIAAWAGAEHALG